MYPNQPVVTMHDIIQQDKQVNEYVYYQQNKKMTAGQTTQEQYPTG